MNSTLRTVGSFGFTLEVGSEEQSGESVKLDDCY